MGDRLTKTQRSYCMSRIRSKNTELEKQVFNALKKRGLKFKKHTEDLPGRPDIVVLKTKKAVFIDSDFWHGWRYPTWSHKLKNEFWTNKILSNRKRDKKVNRLLRKSGWAVMRVWEHSLKKDLPSVVKNIVNFLTSR